MHDIPFFNGDYAMSAALAGGMNAPQFSDADLNGDGKMDLFIFERSSNTIITMLNEGDGNYVYAPEYEKIFPPMEDWALLRDYNCDGITDIFTYYIGSTKVYTGRMTDGVLSFELTKSKLSYYDEDSESYVFVYTSRTDIPSIDDIDSDGDLDILSFSVSNTTIRYYKNLSVESGYNCDSLEYDLVEYCWGFIYEGFTCGGADLNIECKGGPDAEADGPTRHTGSTSLTFDKDGDGDKDLVLGDNSCNNLVYYINGGDSEFSEMVYKDTLFPLNTVSYNAPVFPATFLFDADDDGDEDLVATTNDNILGLNTEHIWLYENQNTNDTFDFVFATDTFLISSMVDAGNYSSPTYFDYNSDGLMDIVIGVNNTNGSDHLFHHGLWLYENIGSAAAPEFKLVSKDFIGLDTYALSNLVPFFSDADNDGDSDLFCGTYGGKIIYAENLAGAGGVADFNTPDLFYQSINPGQYSAPCLIDIDEDGKPDMIVGEQNGNLNYYHNTGTATAPAFTLESEIWGGVDVRKTGFLTGHSIPFMYRNENDSLYLIVGSESGQVFLFNEIEDALAGEFYEADTNFLKYDIGTFTSVCRNDINADGLADYLAGNIRGGISIMEKDFSDGVEDPVQQTGIKLYPNPAADFIWVHIDGSGNETRLFQLFNVSGAMISETAYSGNQVKLALDKTLANGIYFIRVSGPDMIAGRSFLLMR